MLCKHLKYAVYMHTGPQLARTVSTSVLTCKTFRVLLPIVQHNHVVGVPECICCCVYNAKVVAVLVNFCGTARWERRVHVEEQ